MNANIHNLECLQEINLNLSIAEYVILNFIFEFIFVTVVCFNRILHCNACFI